jgi:tripartite-type tricarboxylate transporter receptor subunit TctC
MKTITTLTLVLCTALGLALAASQAAAEEYPDRAIEILVPFGAGGGSDTAARAVVERMKPQLKNGVLVNNMPGGGATKAMLCVSQRRPTASRCSPSPHPA